jgi:hypothetical protein
MSRRLIIGFDGRPHGSLSVRGGKLHADGPNRDAVLHHAEAALHSLAYRPDADRLTADDVLDYLAESLQGRTHAHWEDNRDDQYT